MVRFATPGAMMMAALIAGGCAEHRPLAIIGPPIELDRVPIQYDDYVQDSFAINDEQWAAIRALFEPPAADPSIERERLRVAIGMFERIAGEQTPTHRDKVKNDESFTGAMDCIDESTNTTTYLRLLQERGLLKWHQVMGRAFRGPLELDTHWTAQVRDITTCERYAVDSWYLDNGHPPYVQLIEQWKRKAPFAEEQVAADAGADAGQAEGFE